MRLVCDLFTNKTSSVIAHPLPLPIQTTRAKQQSLDNQLHFLKIETLSRNDIIESLMPWYVLPTMFWIQNDYNIP